jgi:hypothetical protein
MGTQAASRHLEHTAHSSRAPMVGHVVCSQDSDWPSAYRRNQLLPCSNAGACCARTKVRPAVVLASSRSNCFRGVKLKLCTGCPNEISAKRLAAMPNAKLCLDCAASNEERGPYTDYRNMERLGRVMVQSDDSYEAKRPRRTRLSTGGISQAMELGI